jgi:hypothetical protein
MNRLIIVGFVTLLAGCTGANISSQARESGDPGSSKMIRCIDISTSDETKSNARLQQYDGWKMVYISEYTTPNKTDSAMVMCFEKKS